MKLAVAIAGKDAILSAFVVWRGFEESIRKASVYGYQGVELALKTAEDVNPEILSGWLDKWGMEVSCISTGQVFAALGLYFTHPDIEARKKVVGVFSGLIHLAKDFGKMVNVGRARGFIDDIRQPEKSERLFIDTAKRICDIAAAAGVDIVLEPVNRYEINFINSVDEGASLIAKAGCTNLGLMPDIFHMNIEDVKIGDTIAANAGLIRYIHFADSNRLAPGQGHLDFNDVFRGLQASGYDGWASIEILPKPDPDTAARQAAEFILPRLKKYNKAIKSKDML